jgi:hypothetical protein
MGPTAFGVSCAKDFIALENPLPSARFEHLILGSNDRQDNHQTTEDDYATVNMVQHRKAHQIMCYCFVRVYTQERSK